jgi:hypothetical protein
MSIRVADIGAALAIAGAGGGAGEAHCTADGHVASATGTVVVTTRGEHTEPNDD